MVKKLLYVTLSAMFFLACAKDKSKDNTSEDLSTPDSVEQKAQQKDIPEDAFDNIVNSFSSPIEMAAYVKESGAGFSKSYLSPIESADKLNTEYEKALGLGILSSDLGYLNVYEKTSSIINLIGEIKRLADDLRIGQFFDFETLKELAMSQTHLDSLMTVSTNSFNRMDQYLRDQNRSKISTLMISGVWIEGMYFATEIVKKSGQEDIREFIGNQKMILKDLVNILEIYKSDSNVADLLEQLKSLQQVYQNVQITYTKGETETRVEEGRMIVIQKTESNAEMDDATLENIISKTNEIRNNIIKL